MGFRRDYFVFCLSQFLVIFVSMRVMLVHSHFVLRKFAKPAKVYTFQTLIMFLDHILRNRHVNMTKVIQAVLTGTLIPKS